MEERLALSSRWPGVGALMIPISGLHEYRDAGLHC